MDLKVLLSIPPDYEHDLPPLGTPALTAFLKRRGFSCAQTDLNIGYRDYLANKVRSSPSAPLTAEDKRALLKPAIKKLFASRLKGRYYSNMLPADDAGMIEDLPYDNNTNSSFYFCERLLSSAYLWRYIEDAGENTFLQFFNDSGILDRLKKDNIGLFCISITSPSQVIAGLTLGLLIKKNLPHIHVNIGGQWATLYRETIMLRKDLFRSFDSVITFEGESALYQLAISLDSKKPFMAIPNIIVRDTDMDLSAGRVQENMDLLPCPDFDGLPLKEYGLSRDGKLSVTFETSRGCYWGKCAYCVDLPIPKPSYRRKSPKLVVDDMAELNKKYGAEYLYFSDPGLSPRQMSEISKCIIERGVDIEWWTMARLDPGFSRPILELARRAGLRQINFGFESANDRVCKSLDKGNERARSSRVIKDCAGAGIKVDLQTMVGLPGESFEEGLDTIDFLVAHKEYISHATLNTYYLAPFNYVHSNPAKYGIEYSPDYKLPFSFFIPFHNVRGMNTEEAELLKRIFYTLAAKDSAPIGADPDINLERSAEFGINGESCTIHYFCDRSTGEINAIEEKMVGEYENARSAA